MEVMKAKRIKLSELKEWPQLLWGTVNVEEKIDGFRYTRRNGRWLSRQNKAFFNVKEIQKVLDSLPKIKSRFIIDGELSGRDWSHTMTLFRSSKADVSDELKDGRYKVFDLVDPNNLDEPFRDRRERLVEVLGKIKHPQIRVIKSETVNSFEDFKELNGFHLSSGCDGSIIKFLGGSYEFKRSKLWLKVKPTNTLDCKIVGFKEGKGKFVGMLGSLEIRVPIKNGWSKETSNISGMNDEDRVRMWRNKKSLLGTIVEVEFRKLSDRDRVIEGHVHRPRPDKEA